MKLASFNHEVVFEFLIFIKYEIFENEMQSHASDYVLENKIK